jgi:hypothetical protein
MQMQEAWQVLWTALPWWKREKRIMQELPSKLMPFHPLEAQPKPEIRINGMTNLLEIIIETLVHVL